MSIVIKRDYYLNKLIECEHDGYVKFITGIRRCGKSYLLNTLFKAYLLTKGVKEDKIIEISLDNDDFEHLRHPRALSSYVKERITSQVDDYYLLLDEIQMCESVPSLREGVSTELTFYDVLNGLLKLHNLDIYVTGSNSKMLSDEIPTHFRDRGETIRLYPLTFSEYFPVSGLSEYRAWNEYLVYGGMPEAVLKKTAAAKKEYLKSLFKTLYLQDIIERNHLQSDNYLGAVLDVLMSAVGSLTNPTNLANTLYSVQRSAPSVHTIQNYIKYLRQAYIFEKADRYDVKGRKYLSYPSKYYVEDVGLRNARLNYRQTEKSHLMENIIYNELLSRGASVDVGVIETHTSMDGLREKRRHEIDFVVNLGMDRIYIQSALEMPDEAKTNQELFSLRKIGDSFRKMVITGDDQPFFINNEGISFVGIIPFLLDKSILEQLSH